MAAATNDLKSINYAEPPQKVFRSIEHFKRVRAAILKALSSSQPPTAGGRSGRQKKSEEDSYLFSRLIVRFSSELKQEEIFLDYAKGHVVLEAPMEPRESKNSLSQRRMTYYSNLIRSVEAMATIGITHIYLVLDDKGRKDLEILKLKASPSKRGKRRVALSSQ